MWEREWDWESRYLYLACGMWLSVGGCKSMEERAREQMSKGNNSSSWRSKSFGENERERESEREMGALDPWVINPNEITRSFLPSFLHSLFYFLSNKESKLASFCFCEIPAASTTTTTTGEKIFCLSFALIWTEIAASKICFNFLSFVCVASSSSSSSSSPMNYSSLFYFPEK